MGDPIGRPGAGDFADFYAGYVGLVPEADVLRVLRRQRHELGALLANLPDSRGDHRYAPGKWTLKEVVGHVADSERVFAYRALRFARGDSSDLPGFDQDPYVEASAAASRSLAELAAELDAVRTASVALFSGLPAAAWARGGVASGHWCTVRALAYITAGHAEHHRRILAERYLSTGG